MKAPPTFEIKVAVIGPVSAGKSTLINAMLVGKYSEMSIRRTTAGVNFFRLNPPQESNTVEQADKPTATGVEWSMMFDKSDSEDSVLKEITKDNKTLREVDGVCEKTFDIEGIQLCECREDTKIVILDIPGLDEVESSSKYRDYVANRWNQFDCVILVMDARHGVNTEEQVGLLEFVKKNLDEEKDIPVIILFNKVDELDVEEEQEITDEARMKISNIFETSGSSDIAKSIVDAKGETVAGVYDLLSRDNLMQRLKGHFSNPFVKQDLLPVFIPISARDSYVYRLARAVDQARFMHLEKDLVEGLGKDHIGLRQWEKLSDDQKYMAAYEAISDPAVYKDGISASNFDTFLTVLEYCIGGKTTQHAVIQKQLNITLGCSLASEAGLAIKVVDLYERVAALGSSFKSLKDAFWTKYEVLEDGALIYGQNRELAVPLKELVWYHQLATKAQWKEEQNRTIERATAYLNRFADLALRRKKVEKTLWAFGISQILAMSASPQFLHHFGSLKTVLEFEYHNAIAQQCQNKVKIADQARNSSNSPSGTQTPGTPIGYPTSKVTCFDNSSAVIGKTRSGAVQASGKKRFMMYENRATTCFEGGSASLGAAKRKPKRGFGDGAPANNSHFPDCGTSKSDDKALFQLKDGNWEIVNTGQTLADVPLSDPKHVGHLFWIFCQWMESLEKDTSSGGDLCFLHQNSKYDDENASVVGRFSLRRTNPKWRK